MLLSIVQKIVLEGLKMASEQVGVTALVTAFVRAYHATHDLPVIFNDDLADEWFSEEERLVLRQQMASLAAIVDPDQAGRGENLDAELATVMQLYSGPITLCRSRYCEEELMKEIQNGVEQYIILGAGFDTFAFRHPELQQKLKVFEVDHPVTQSMKRQRIQTAKWKIPENLRFVPVDFASDTLDEALRKTDFNPTRKSFLSWLGVTYYLSLESICKTIKVISDLIGEGSVLLFDYIDHDGFSDDKVGQAVRLIRKIVRQVGEPLQTGFDPQKLAIFLKGYDFQLDETLDPIQIEARYFSGRQDRSHAAENIHFARTTLRR
jgi:methyltransferase (TIGR00027 family)